MNARLAPTADRTASGPLRVREPLFLVPGAQPGGEPLVYAPLSGLLFEISHDAHARMARLIEDGWVDTASLPPAEVAFVDSLAELRVLTPDSAPAEEIDVPDNGVFQPTTVTLFLTGRCNLTCGYCYADGGASGARMSWEVAQAAIDTVIESAAARGERRFSLIFHGSGEPTLALPLMQRCVGYARELATGRGLQPHFSLGTNGLMPAASADWIANNIDDITLSVDGPPDVQDAQRPGVGGRAVGERVMRTLRRLEELGARYAIRVTVTAASQHRLPEIVRWLCESSAAIDIQLEPVGASGRAGSGGGGVDPAVMVRGFLAAAPIAASAGRRLGLAGTDPDGLRHQYCGMGQDSFVATESGTALACYETARPEDPRRGHFTIGGRRGERFEFASSAALDLRAESLAVKAPCEACWARFSCAGDCHAKMAGRGDPETEVDPDRCYMIREVARARLLAVYGYGWPATPSRPAPRSENTP